MNFTDVIFSVMPGAGGNVGKILLNRPQNLNALNLKMCVAIHRQLEQWTGDKSIKAVIISGTGDKAFCAGGDIRAVYKLCAEQGRYNEAMDFFQQEYAMNQALFEFPKPYIAFLDGITMGGGVGISIHGSHTIATEHLVWAMPETRIGFFPDVGTGYHLAKLPHQSGRYLALCSHRINAWDAFKLGLVTAVTTRAELADLEKALINTPFNPDDFDIVSQIVKRYHHEPDTPVDSWELLFPDIQLYFSKDSMEAIYDDLCRSHKPWCIETAHTLRLQSPFSLKITLAHLQHCESFNFIDVMAENFRLAENLIHQHDFMEGIRAAMIDKDHRPQWLPDTLSQITDEEVQKCFLISLRET